MDDRSETASARLRSLPARADANWATKLPDGIPRLESHLVVIKNPIMALQKLIQQTEEVADNPAQKGSTIAVRPDLGLSGALFTGTTRFAVFAPSVTRLRCVPCISVFCWSFLWLLIGTVCTIPQPTATMME